MLNIKAIHTRYYLLLLSPDPCSVFRYFHKEKLHGLSIRDCLGYNNSEKDAYISGWTNYIPHTKKVYCFINTQRCTDSVHTTGTIMHELMHVAFLLNNRNIEQKQEKLITWVEQETYWVYSQINRFRLTEKKARWIPVHAKKKRNRFLV